MKDLLPLQPWKTPSPSFPYQNQNGQYVKLKKPLVRDGTRVFWQVRMMQNEDDDLDIDIPYKGVFEFIDKWVIKTIRVWVDWLFGEIFSLPKVG